MVERINIRVDPEVNFNFLKAAKKDPLFGLNFQKNEEERNKKDEEEKEKLLQSLMDRTD